MSTKVGICTWCSKNTKLVDAHIVPSAFYEQLVDTGGVPLVLGSEPGFRPKRRPSGTYDPGILCASCEARFSPWDDYGVQIFRDQASLDPSRYVSDGQGGHFFQLEANADGRLLQFLTSLLWRASVSNQHEFQRVTLGPHAEIIKQALLKPISAELERYSFVITRFTDDIGNKVMSGPYPFPIKLKTGSSLNAYMVSLPGWALIVKVDKREWPNPLDGIAYQVGKPTLAVMTDSATYKSFLDGIVEIMKISRERVRG